MKKESFFGKYIGNAERISHFLKKTASGYVKSIRRKFKKVKKMTLDESCLQICARTATTLLRQTSEQQLLELHSGGNNIPINENHLRAATFMISKEIFW